MLTFCCILFLIGTLGVYANETLVGFEKCDTLILGRIPKADKCVANGVTFSSIFCLKLNFRLKSSF